MEMCDPWMYEQKLDTAFQDGAPAQLLREPFQLKTAYLTLCSTFLKFLDLQHILWLKEHERHGAGESAVQGRLLLTAYTGGVQRNALLTAETPNAGGRSHTVASTPSQGCCV